ncbi:predicted protein [Botrytis cinerea T4]|uniref:Uncharacterized protein n=1 Tax=Botryotinia fuckeliana (strain T4) TaxID=999810 RepID=G2YAC5_BOTF4|nr:predicted protein [Botrytis cinerea T4]
MSIYLSLKIYLDALCTKYTIQNPLAIRDPRIPMNFFSPPLASTTPATLLRIQLAPFYLFSSPSLRAAACEQPLRMQDASVMKARATRKFRHQTLQSFCAQYASMVILVG